MNNINVTVELGPESMAKLDKILETLQGIQPDCHRCTETAMRIMADNLKIVTGQDPAELPSEAARAVEAAAPETAHPMEEVSPHGAPEPAAALEQPEAPKYTKADVQAIVQKLAAPTSPEHKRAGAKAIVKSYGARVSDIPEDKYAEVMDKLTALDKEGKA